MVTIATQRNAAAWKKQEQQLQDDGARKVPGSGSGELKGDNKSDVHLIQAKTTKFDSRKVTLEELRKTTQEALQEDRIPVMQLQFRDSERYAVLRWEDFEELLEAAGRKI